MKPGFSSGSTLGEPSDDCFLARLDGTSNAGDTSDTGGHGVMPCFRVDKLYAPSADKYRICAVIQDLVDAPNRESP